MTCVSVKLLAKGDIIGTYASNHESSSLQGTARHAVELFVQRHIHVAGDPGLTSDDVSERTE
jgi:hypothetical protein